MPKIVRVMSNEQGADSSLKLLKICIPDNQRSYLQCVDYSIYYTDIGWKDGLPSGGIKRIDEDQNGGGMADQGGTNWREGDDPTRLSLEMAKILRHFSEAEKIEVISITDHTYR